MPRFGSMEFEVFQEIRHTFCVQHPEVTEGKMMSSPALHFKGKVFAFFSRKERMVFKLGKDFPLDSIEKSVQEFNPFKNKGPLTGWYELPFENKNQWEEMTLLALDTIKKTGL